jgi:hypothetical protein
MRSIFLVSLLLSSGPLVAQDVVKEQETKTIVVTARSLSDTEKALRDCLARKCSPDEDAKATIAHAENQFVNGNMKDARGTLLKSIGRNGSYAKKYPTNVADLYRANARVAAHLGEGKDFQFSTIKTRDSLKAGLGADDWRVIASNIEVADMRAKLGYFEEAERLYNDLEKTALAKGWNGMADVARLRSAMLYYSSDLSDKKAAGKKRLEGFASRAGDEHRALRIASKILLAKTVKSKEESSRLMSEVNSEYVTMKGKLPQLLYSESIEQPDDPALASKGGVSEGGRNPLKNLQTQSVENNWVDIGFWVTPEGKVQDVELIRSGLKDTAWTKPVVKSINARIYSKTDADPGSPGMFMVERYTLTALKEEQIGTRLQRRSPRTRIERIDLTEIPADSNKS